MKRKTKNIFRGLAGLVVLLAAALVAVAFLLGAIVKKGVETYGPTATGVDVKLKSAEVWLLAGRAQLGGLVLGNPPGCKTPTAIVVDHVSVRIRPGSVFSDKVVVESLELKAPVITLEGGFTDNNLKKIEKNLGDYTDGLSSARKSPASSSSPAKPKKTFQVNDLVITGAKLQVNMTLTAGQTLTLPIPDIHLTNLGTGPEGVTSADVARQALHAVLAESITAVTKNAGDLGKQALGTVRDAAQKAADTLKGLIH
jgi:uncharacterized protein involved in outer membrane biogenesis